MIWDPTGVSALRLTIPSTELEQKLKSCAVGMEGERRRATRSEGTDRSLLTLNPGCRYHYHQALHTDAVTVHL